MQHFIIIIIFLVLLALRNIMMKYENGKIWQKAKSMSFYIDGRWRIEKPHTSTTHITTLPTLMY